MNNPVYTFGPQADQAIADSLRRALSEMFPQHRFDVAAVPTLTGLRAAVVLLGRAERATGPDPTFQRMVMFSRGFVAGFDGEAVDRTAALSSPSSPSSIRMRATLADCPTAKAKGALGGRGGASAPEFDDDPTQPGRPSSELLLAATPPIELDEERARRMRLLRALRSGGAGGGTR